MVRDVLPSRMFQAEESDEHEIGFRARGRGALFEEALSDNGIFEAYDSLQYKGMMEPQQKRFKQSD